MNYLNLLSVLGIGGAHPGGLLLTKEIIENEHIPLDSLILDAGCGTGQTTSYLFHLGYQVTGLDKNKRMIEHAKKRNQNLNIDIPYLNEDLTNTSIANETYDFILCESVLNFTSLQHTLPEIKRILKQNGVIIAIEMIRVSTLSKDEIGELTTFYGCDQIFSINEWKKQFSEKDLTLYKILCPDDFSIEEQVEPTTEFSPIEQMPESTFTLLSEHEKLTNKYANKLSFRVFFIRK